jgi:hypothetical protein
MASACRWFCFGLGLFLLCGCGGSERAADSAATAGDETASKSDDEADGAGTDDAESSADAPAAEPKASCDDGTCTTCGSALCPSGWYCDEGAKGGPACGWLPECARTPTCACVKRAFNDCSCEDQGGAAHLRCG